jgi:phage-related minor tail protein
LGIQIFDLYREDIENLVKGIGKLITKFKNLNPKTQKTIITIAGIAAVIGPVLVLFGTFLLTLAPI